jgi:hypothetical protein
MDGGVPESEVHGGMTADVMPCINNVVEEGCLSTQGKREVSFDSISIYQAISDIRILNCVKGVFFGRDVGETNHCSHGSYWYAQTKTLD